MQCTHDERTGWENMNQRRMKRQSTLSRTGVGRWARTPLLALLLVAPAWGHNLDPKSMDRYSEVLLGASSGQFYYVVLYGADWTAKAKEFMGIEVNESPDPELEQAWVADVAPVYLEGVSIALNGQPIVPRQAGGAARPSTGHGGIPVIEVVLVAEFDYPADLPRGEPVPFSVDDRNFRGPRSWLQTRVVPLEGVRVEGRQPYSNVDPFNYFILDNANILPTTRKLSLQVTLPEPGAELGAGLGEGTIETSGHQAPQDEVPETTAYGPTELARVLAPEEEEDRYGEKAKIRWVFLGGLGAFLLGALVLIVYRVTLNRSKS